MKQISQEAAISSDGGISQSYGSWYAADDYSAMFLTQDEGDSDVSSKTMTLGIKPASVTLQAYSNSETEIAIDAALGAFEAWMQNSDLKQSTRQVYASRLKQYRLFVKSCNVSLTLPVSSSKFAELATAFMDRAINQYGLSWHSVNNFASMFRLLALVNGLSLEGMERKVVRLPEAKGLTELEMERYLLSASRTNARNYLIALIFSQTTIRIGECRKLKLSDVLDDGCNVYLAVQNGNVHRKEILSPIAGQTLRVWLGQRADVSSEYLFYGSTGQPLTTTAIDLVLRKIGWRSGLVVCSRLLRYTCLNKTRRTP